MPNLIAQGLDAQHELETRIAPSPVVVGRIPELCDWPVMPADAAARFLTNFMAEHGGGLRPEWTGVIEMKDT